MHSREVKHPLEAGSAASIESCPRHPSPTSAAGTQRTPTRSRGRRWISKRLARARPRRRRAKQRPDDSWQQRRPSERSSRSAWRCSLAAWTSSATPCPGGARPRFLTTFCAAFLRRRSATDHYDAAFALAEVCAQWRRVALGSRTLWSRVAPPILGEDNVARHYRRVVQILSRSHAAPLDVAIEVQLSRIELQETA